MPQQDLSDSCGGRKTPEERGSQGSVATTPGQADKSLREQCRDEKAEAWRHRRGIREPLPQGPPPTLVLGSPPNTRQGTWGYRAASQAAFLLKTETHPHTHFQCWGFLPHLNTVPRTTLTSCLFQSLGVTSMSLWSLLCQMRCPGQVPSSVLHPPPTAQMLPQVRTYGQCAWLCCSVAWV